MMSKPGEIGSIKAVPPAARLADEASLPNTPSFTPLAHRSRTDVALAAFSVVTVLLSGLNPVRGPDIPQDSRFAAANEARPLTLFSRRVADVATSLGHLLLF